MGYFEYAAVYFGIIAGLALANILTSFHKLIEAGRRVRWGLFAPASALYAATLTLGEFWSVWLRQHDMGHRIFFTWLPLAAAFALLFLMCAAALPDEVGEAGVDLDRFYIDNRRRFWGFSFALHALNLVSWAVTLTEYGFSAQALQHSLTPILGNTGEAALSLTLIWTRAKWWHALVLAGLWIYALCYFGPMPLT